MAMSFLLKATVLSCIITLCLCSSAKFPFQDPSLPWDDRVEDFLGRLTLQEIIEQSMAIYDHPTPALPHLGVKPYMWITECEHGHSETLGTAFPNAFAMASSFSRQLVNDVAVAISYEIRAHWNNNSRHGEYPTYQGLGCFAPVINIMRHPFWGRNQETQGEDPWMAGQMAKEFIQGLQGHHPRYVRVNAGCKHYDAHGGPENIPQSRFSFNANVTTRDLRMTFFPAFKACVDAGSYSVMCSYNSINGVPACGNKEILTQVLRDDWGFQGYVVSDANAVSNMMTAHNYTHTPTQTAVTAIEAGCNLELTQLPATKYNYTIEAIHQGLITEERVRENARPLIYTRMRLGLFDPPELNPYNAVNLSVVQSAEHRALALKAAMMSMVLLKNTDNTLPLTHKYNKLAIVGPAANNSKLLYGGSTPKVNDQYVVTPLMGLQKLATSTQYASGCSNTSCSDYNQNSIQQAVQGADLLIICLGLGPDLENEGIDRANLDLPGRQLDLLLDATNFASGAKVILLMFNVDPMNITAAQHDARVGAILECFYPSQSAGDAIYKLLRNEGPHGVPAARLAATWPASTQQIPPMINYTMVGRTYRYFNGDPQYPFGYGLSYSTFRYHSLIVAPKVIEAGQSVYVSVDVSNKGPFDADEVVQLYMSWANLSLSAPQISLVGFERVSIPNEGTVTVKFTVTGEQMALWMDDATGFDVSPGNMTLYAGGQQPNQGTRISSNVLNQIFTIQPVHQILR